MVKILRVVLNHNIISNVVNDKFDIQGINSTRINILIYMLNNNKNNKLIELFDYNTVQVIYNDNIDVLKSDTNKNDISSNLEIINTNKNNISSNLEQIIDIKSLLPTSEIFKKTFTIKNQSFRFASNVIYFKLSEIEIENNFNVDEKLEINGNIYYKYDNLQLDHHRLQHEYHIYDDKNKLLHKKILNKTNSTDLNFDNNIMLVKDNFYVTFNNNYNKITILLYLFRVYRHGTGNFNLQLINENFVNISYLDKNDISLKIDTNKNDIASNLGKISTNERDILSNSKKITTNEGNISSNLGKITTNEGNISTNLIKINSNEDDILYNLSEINHIKNNKSTQYLKKRL